MTYERDNIAGMKGYTSGEQPNDPDTVKLNTNENPWPASPAVDAVLAGIDRTDLRRYPPPLANEFRDRAADYHRLARDNFIATRGGDELLRLVITTFVDPGEVIAMTDPTYSLYPVLAKVQDASTFTVPLAEDWSIPADFAEKVNAAGAKLTLVVNPHAPSGKLVGADWLRELALSLDGLLLVDEAYVDFIDPGIDYDATSLVRELNNVILLRTLSKGYSLAGLRFGYGIASPELIAPMLGKTRDSYNLDYISQKIAAAALGDIIWARDTWQKVREERARLFTRLSRLGLEVLPSQANFLLARVPAELGEAQAVYEALKRAGILVRYFDQPRLEDKLRISIGTPAENDRLLAELSVCFSA